ncbi:MAG: response regulator [Eubacteriales bacterium]
MKATPTALVADDLYGIRHLLLTIMEEIGYKVSLAKNGFEAVEAVEKYRPNLVFLDVQMPVMNGLQALGKIKAISPETTVILMTAYISNEVVSEAIEKGAGFCITKPFNMDKARPFLQKFYEEKGSSCYCLRDNCSLALPG